MSDHVSDHAVLRAGVWHYAKMARSQWIESSLGMVTLAGSHVWWTWETEDAFRRVREGDKHAMKAYAGKLTQQLAQLTGMVSGCGWGGGVPGACAGHTCATARVHACPPCRCVAS
jgi:hypothetical protein